MSRQRILPAWLALASAIGACGGRPSYWNASVTGTAISYGLSNGVALVDDPDHRVVMLTALADQQVATRALPIGHNMASAVTSPDGQRLFVLSTGDWPRRNKTDEYPSLTVIDATGFDPQATLYRMTVPLPKLAIDPLKHWAVAFAGAGATTTFVQNPNEIVIFDLTAPGSTPISRTIQSFGGTPQRLTFTPELQLPNGQRRLLVIETDIDVSLLDLDNASKPTPPPPITVRLTSGANAHQVTPAGVVVDGFDPTNPAHARIALRASADRNVFTLTLGPSTDPTAANDFTPIINLTDVGGEPSDIAFVRTDAGLRVAALVPLTSRASLVDPNTSITTSVALPAAYSKLSLVTSVVGGTSTDVAMLWNASGNASSGVALWALGNTVGKPYFSVEVLGVAQPIEAVHDVMADDRLKVLETTNANNFFVLDLVSRTASPLDTMGKATLAIAPDGKRLWAFARGGTDLAKLEFLNLNPVLLTTDTPIDSVYDVARPPSGGGDGGRSLIAIHRQGTVGATVFDAQNPDTAASRHVSALLLEGP
jgi:hypothetical protein